MNGVLYINKPMNMTSFDVVSQCRRKLKERSIGHTGTLDPNATGVLILLVGKATKVLPYLEHNEKEYIATCKVGIQTTTGDIWGEVTDENHHRFSLEQLHQVLTGFIGKQTQIPPMVSAIKVDGKPLYQLARQGKEIERKPREIEISQLELLDYKPDEFTICAKVSSGTYMRTLLEDICKACGTLGTLSALKRTQASGIRIEQCCDLDEVTETTPLHSLFEVLNQSYPCIEIDKIDDVKNGKRIHLDCHEPLVILTHHQEVLAAYEKTSQGDYQCKRGLW